MPEATFRHTGNAIDYTPGAAVAAGAVIVQGTLIGVAANDIEANALGSLQIEGVFEVTKGGDAYAAGADVFWDDAGKAAVPTDGGGANQLMGVAVLAAAAGDSFVWVKLSP